MLDGSLTNEAVGLWPGHEALYLFAYRSVQLGRRGEGGGVIQIDQDQAAELFQVHFP